MEDLSGSGEYLGFVALNVEFQEDVAGGGGGGLRAPANTSFTLFGSITSWPCSLVAHPARNVAQAIDAREIRNVVFKYNPGTDFFKCSLI